MGIYNTNQQWTTYRILDASILNVDVAAAAAIDFTKLGPTGALTVGASGAGYDVTLYGDNAGSDFLWDQNGDSNIGLLQLGGSGGSKGVEFIVYGATNGNSLQWDQSADDLLLVGTATQLGIAGTTDAGSAATGSIHTAGGIGIGAALWVGTTSRLVGAITADSTLGIAGLITSTSTTGFRSNPTFVPDTTYTNYAFSVGNKVAELTVNFAQSTGQNFNPIQAIVNCTATGTGPTASSQTNLFFAQLTHDTNDMAFLRLKCADFTTIVGENVLDAYAYQGEIDFTKSGITVGGEAVVMGLVMNAGSDAVTGTLRGATIAMTGAGMPALSSGLFIYAGTGATLTHGLYLATQGGTTMTNAIYIETGGTLTNVLKFGETSAAVVSTASGGLTRSYSIRCAVGGVTGYLSLYTD